jgi:hypothetical protein
MPLPEFVTVSICDHAGTPSANAAANARIRFPFNILHLPCPTLMRPARS